MNESRDALIEAAVALNESKAARNLMEAFSRSVQLDLRGEGGPFHMTIRDGRLTVREGEAASADLVVSGDTQEFVRVVKGQVDVSHPIAHGKLRVDKGKVSDMTLLNRILSTTKRGAAS